MDGTLFVVEVSRPNIACSCAGLEHTMTLIAADIFSIITGRWSLFDDKTLKKLKLVVQSRK